MPAARAFGDRSVLGWAGVCLDFVDGPQLGAHAANAAITGDDDCRRLAGELAGPSILSLFRYLRQQSCSGPPKALPPNSLLGASYALALSRNFAAPSRQQKLSRAGTLLWQPTQHDEAHTTLTPKACS